MSDTETRLKKWIHDFCYGKLGKFESHADNEAEESFAEVRDKSYIHFIHIDRSVFPNPKLDDILVDEAYDDLFKTRDKAFKTIVTTWNRVFAHIAHELENAVFLAEHHSNEQPLDAVRLPDNYSFMSDSLCISIDTICKGLNYMERTLPAEVKDQTLSGYSYRELFFGCDVNARNMQNAFYKFCEQMLINKKNARDGLEYFFLLFDDLIFRDSENGEIDEEKSQCHFRAMRS
ncbi:MAG: hypothetical protein AAF065_13255 [Verrucomicrobiota bacterium]